MGPYQYFRIDTIAIFLTYNIEDMDNMGDIFLFLICVPNVQFSSTFES